MSRAQEIAERTPAQRDRYVDLLRAASIIMVVSGHWLVIDLSVENGSVSGQNVLGILDWTHWATWVFQVMPVFFFVGGFANAASWDSHRRKRGGRWVPWALERTDRLLRPTTAFLALGVAVVVVARLGGLDPAFLDRAAWLVTIALWFLAVYVVLSAFSPLLIAAHERWGSRVVVALIGGVVLVDVLRLGLGMEWVGVANFALGWLVFQQLGFLWRDGDLTRNRLLAPAAAVLGFGTLVAVTTIGPYPVSMVSVPGEELDNTGPTTFALVALGITQMGAALTVRPFFDRWLERARVWVAVVGVNAVILTIYLWHLVPVVVAGVLLLSFPDLPQPAPESATWLPLRPAWMAALAVLLVPMVLAASVIERRAGSRDRPPQEGYGLPSAVAMALGVAAVSVGLAMITIGGLHGDGPLGLPLGAIAAYVPGVVLVRVALTLRASVERADA
jgi:fucose 4-O-acetylase-like acetyltransferase